MAQDARALANHFLQLSKLEGRPLTHLHMQKILYFAHGYYLAYYKEPLIQQTVEAWKHGPVIPDVYNSFRRYGRNPITDLVATFDDDLESAPFQASLDLPTTRYLASVWDTYKSVSPYKLSEMSHVKDGPWYAVSKDKNLEVHRGVVIPNSTIRDYFLSLVGKK